MRAIKRKAAAFRFFFAFYVVFSILGDILSINQTGTARSVNQ